MDFTREILAKYLMTTPERAKLKASIGKVIRKIGAESKRLKLKTDVVLGGSAAKGTMLKGDFDVDLFVRFDRKYKNAGLSNLLAKILKSFKPVRLQGSRDYFQFSQDGVGFEIVPVLKISTWKEAVNVTDASPLHVLWVAKRTKANKKILEDIVLTKVFLKANKLYGAESYIGGFSGHVVDILIINYGSFSNFIKAAAKWVPYIMIDVERQCKGKRHDLNQSKIGPLILIDPVQPQRNAAAAVNMDVFRRMIDVAREYIKKPGPEFFAKKDDGMDALKRRAGTNRLIAVELKLNKEKVDVNGAKIVKALEFLSSKLAENDFKVLDKGWCWDKGAKATIWVMVDSTPLDKVKIHVGPPIAMADHVAAFRKLYKNATERDGRIAAEIKRKYLLPEKLVADISQADYLTEKFRSISFKP